MLLSGSKDKQFFTLLISAAYNMAETAQEFLRLAEEPQSAPQRAVQIKTLEKKGDGVTHEIFALLNKLFITPLEREDILLLTVRLDDVTDGLEAAAARIHLYKLTEHNQFFVQFAKVIQLQVNQIVTAVERLDSKDLQVIRKNAMRINELENEADELLRGSLEDLFDRETNPVMIIKLKEIYEMLESVTDSAEDVANALESVVMKNS